MERFNYKEMRIFVPLRLYTVWSGKGTVGIVQRYTHLAPAEGRLIQPWLRGLPKSLCQ